MLAADTTGSAPPPMSATGSVPAGSIAALLAAAADAGEDIAVAIALACGIADQLPQPGRGSTLQRWRTLAAVARVNVTVARVLEAHSDALAILAEAAVDDADTTGYVCPADGKTAALQSWGVFAAEAPDKRLDAARHDGAFRLTGVKPWCSLGDVLDRALITARDGDDRRLFQVDLRDPSVTAWPERDWVARGLRTVTSVPLCFDRTPARPVGAPGWYLTRPGFSWGGIGVAACWYGAARGIADRLGTAATQRGDQVAYLHAGAADVALYAARSALTDAAARVDGRQADGVAGQRLALRVRGVVAAAAEQVLTHAAHGLGPTPLAFDAAHAAQVADLQLYVRQQHAERDLAALGELIVGAGAEHTDGAGMPAAPDDRW